MPRYSVALAAALLLLLVTSAPLFAANEPTPRAGDLVSVVAEGRLGPFEIQREATPLFGRFGPPIIENAAHSYRITYLTTGLDGELAEIEAQLFVPQLADAPERPLYVFGSGTTGLDRACAPTRESLYRHPLGHYRAYLLAYAGRGFTAVIPDYLGFNEPGRLQSYFNGEAEARVMLDAARAVDQFYAATVRGHATDWAADGVGDQALDWPSPAAAGSAMERSVFLAGYSQGGHAAFAAADLVDVYAPDVELSGIMGFGATTDVESLLREGPYYAPYILLSYQQDYGDELVDPRDLLAPHWSAGIEEKAGRMCVDLVQQHYPFDGWKLYSRDFYRALYTGRLEQEYPGVAQVLDSNNTGLSVHGLPSLVVQGERDVIVWTATQTRFVTELCGRGSDVLYLRYPGVRHKETRPAGFEASIDWMKNLDRGLPAPSNCETTIRSDREDHAHNPD